MSTLTLTSPTIAQVAQETGYSAPTIYNLARYGQIAGVRRSVSGRYQLPSNASDLVVAYFRPQLMD